LIKRIGFFSKSILDMSILSQVRPTDPWKYRYQPIGVLRHGRRPDDNEDEHHNGGDDLKGDGVHMDRDVCSEKSRSTLVAVEEGRSDLQHFHDSWSIESTFAAAIRINKSQST
jgi:hypothetical protein